MSLRCRSCGVIFPDTLETKWGQTRETSGYGSDPKCVNLVKDRLGSNAICGGRLVDSTAAVTFAELHDLDGKVLK